MVLLHPAFLWFAPLLAAPIVIHLLNRLRYRRVRWAAIDFLLASERRAVRRARLRHWLLMALRILLLAAALLALAQPVFRGRLSGLLGGSTQVAIAVDASASMAASDVSGVAFERARKLAEDNVASLPRSSRVVVGTFAARYSSPLSEPLIDHRAVGSLLASAERTSGRGNVPDAIRASAEALSRSGGGGTIWVLTDMQTDGWRAGDDGAWRQVQAALKAARNPKVIVTDMAPAVASNLSISSVRTEPAVLVAGDHPRLIVTVELSGKGPVANNLALHLDEDGVSKQIDSRPVSLAAAGRTDVVFALPAIGDKPITGWAELTPDAMPADDKFYFLLRPSPKVPVLVVDGATSRIWGEGAADYFVEAMVPSQLHLVGRSPFAVKTARPEDVVRANLADYSAVVLADVARLDGDAMDALTAYVEAGGLLLMFPGSRTQLESWNAAKLPGVRLAGPEPFETLEKRPKIAWASPATPVTGLLQPAWLDRVAIDRMYRIDASAGGATTEVLATAAAPGGDLPFLVRIQRGRGKVYLYAVSCQRDFSTLPFTPVMLLTAHRAIMTHLTEIVEPLWQSACQPLRLTLSPGVHQMIVPARIADGNGHEPVDHERPIPVSPLPDNVSQAQFTRTERAGIYRMFEGDKSPAKPSQADPVAAVNVPAEESMLERIAPDTIRRLIGESSVYFTTAATDTNGGNLGGDDSERVSASGFPLAVLAILFAMSEVILGWSLGRPVKEKI
ncbi:MAG: BatA domain-containing protein [Phycisphaerae bacterium]|nr:BatA domain-containing protein [Phycisphaerae bacterium]